MAKRQSPKPKLLKQTEMEFMRCHINTTKWVPCTGECRGATTHWHWETCGYGKRMQKEGPDGDA